jgi:hypothetical protein
MSSSSHESIQAFCRRLLTQVSEIVEIPGSILREDSRGLKEVDMLIPFGVVSVMHDLGISASLMYHAFGPQEYG